MSEADELFEELGYRKYIENEDTLIYKCERETFRISLTFDKRIFKKVFYAVESLWVTNNENWYIQEFKNEFEKYCSTNGYWSNTWHEFTMQELKAINLKCKELRMVGGVIL